MRARRDPRVERQARLVSGTERPRFLLAAMPQTSRPRRDPRTMRRAATVAAGARPRIDWHSGRTGGAMGVSQRTLAEIARVQPEIRIVAEPAFLVLAVPDLPGRALSDHDRQLIGAGRQFADAGGGAVVVLAVSEAAGLDSAGADRVIPLPAGLLAEYDPEGRAAAILAAMDMLRPRHVLFPESAQGGADLARRVAALSGERLFSGVETLSAERISRRTRGGAMEMAGAPPVLMSIAENACSEHEGALHEARTLEALEFSAVRRIESASPLAVEADLLPLADADFILSAGNGVTDWAAFAELGQVLGATLGGSRVVCDEGHLPRDRQVGASGSLVTARCYLAFGIAGAPQHLQGITEVMHVVAVNTDLHAEMIKRADLAIIADAQQVMPALIRHASAAAGTTDLPSPLGRGGREAPGEGVMPRDVALPRLTERPHPLPPSLSQRQTLAVDREGSRWQREPDAAVVSEAAVRVAVLLSMGRHPASGRPRRAALDARALEMALSLPEADIRAIHAGDPAEPALRDYLGMGLERLAVLAVLQASDPVPALSGHLASLSPDVILCGSHAESREDSGMVPYLIARALGCAMVGDVAALSITGGRASLIQALPRGKRRLIETGLPVVAGVSAAAPAPRQSAFARARRGVIETSAAEAPLDPILGEYEISPWRPRPKRMRLTASGSAADRLKAMTETKSGEGAVMIHPSPEDAARAIYDYLVGKRIIEERSCP